MQYLLLQAYGRKSILNEALFHILNFLHFHKDEYGIVLYTDTPEHFAKVASYIHFEALDAAKIQEWKGEINFVHRLKIKMLQDFFQKHQTDVLYVDSDTYPKASIKHLFEAISPQQSIMHIKEGLLSEGYNLLAKKIHRFVKKTTLKIGDKQFKIPANTPMWNAGVLGISKENASLLEGVVNITDTTYSLYQKHIMEQLAFSYVLTQNTQVIPAEPTIYHYWDAGKNFEPILTAFFEENKDCSVQELIQKAHALQPRYVPEPKKSWWKKLIGVK